MKISVIIAAYNAEKYLEPALDSIFHQTLPMEDYEVIIVNDGSTDSTESILQTYSKQYQNCCFFTQQNQGPAAARNAALSKAKGDYLYFFDADDIVAEDALEALHTRAKKQKADVVIARYDIFNEYTISPVTNINALAKLGTINKYDPRLLWTFTLWNKLFRKKLVKDLQLKFPLISYSEDGVFTMHMFLHAKKITGLNQIVLHYRRNYDLNATSITASIAPWKIEHFLKAHDMIRQDIEQTAAQDYPDYKTWDDILKNEPQIALFYHEFEVKELHTIYNQFYSHFWNSDKESRKLILETLDSKLSHTDFATKEEILERDPELLHFSKTESVKQRAAKAQVNICLYGVPEQKEEFLAALASLTSSNYVSYKITMPRYMKKFVKQRGLKRDNFTYLWFCKKDRDIFYQRAVSSVPSEYTILTEPHFLYTYNALSVVMKQMKNQKLDYGNESVYCFDAENETFVLSSLGTYFPYADASAPVDDGTEPEREVFDYLFANKIFRTDFIRPLLARPKQEQFLDIYTKGVHSFFNHQSVLLTKASLDEMRFQKTQENVPDKRHQIYFLSCRVREMNTDLMPLLYHFRTKEETSVFSFIRDNNKSMLTDPVTPIFAFPPKEDASAAAICNDIALRTLFPEREAGAKQVLLITSNNFFYQLAMKEPPEAGDKKRLDLAKFSHILAPNQFIYDTILKNYDLDESQTLQLMENVYHWDLCQEESCTLHYQEFLECYPQAKDKKILFLMLPKKTGRLQKEAIEQFPLDEFLEKLGEEWFVITNYKPLIIRTMGTGKDYTNQLLYINQQYPLENIIYFCDLLITDLAFLATAQAQRAKPFLCMGHNDNAFEKYIEKNHPTLFLQTADDFLSLVPSSELTPEHISLYQEMVFQQNHNPMDDFDSLLLSE